MADPAGLVASLPGLREVRWVGQGPWTDLVEARDATTGRLVVARVCPSAPVSVIAPVAQFGPLLTNLRGPHLPAVRLVEVVDEHVLTLEDHIRSRPLSEFLRTDGATVDDICAVGLAACTALEQAHRVGLLHRSVSPDAIVLDGDNTPIVIEFGLVQLLCGTESLVRAAQIGGTDGDLLAPEQVVSGVVGPHTDVYGLAASLYLLLSGRPPYADVPGGVVARLAARLERPPSHLSSRADIPVTLADVIMGGLAPDPSERFGDAVAFGAALFRGATRALGSGWLDDTPVNVYCSSRIVERVVSVDGGPATEARRREVPAAPERSKDVTGVMPGDPLISVRDLLVRHGVVPPTGEPQPVARVEDPAPRTAGTEPAVVTPIAPSTVLIRLILVDPTGRRSSIDVRGMVVLGRRGADISLTDPKVSRLHCRVHSCAHGVVIEDLGSSNGTYFGGERIDTATEVATGEEFRIGDSTIRVAAASDPPVPTGTAETGAPAPAPAPTAPTAGPGPDASGRSFNRWFLVPVVALVATLLLRVFVIQLYSIPSESMQPALQVGDRVLVDKLSTHVADPSRGDVIVFDNPAAGGPGEEDFLVKRVVAVGGDSIAFDEGALIVNDQRLAEPFVPAGARTDPQVLACSAATPCALPPGALFVLGDNRENSQDSRTFGPIQVSSVIGQARVIAWPPTRLARL